MLRLKDLFLVGLVVFSLVLLSDDSNQIKERLNEFAESADKPRPITTASTKITTTVSESDAAEAAEDYTKEGEKLQSKANAQYGLSLAAFERSDWEGCLNRCLSANNYYDRSIHNSLNEWEELKEGNENRVMAAFIDASMNYYSCKADVSISAMEVCDSMENSCLAYSQDDSGTGYREYEEAVSHQETLENEEDRCDNILNSLVNTKESSEE